MEQEKYEILFCAKTFRLLIFLVGEIKTSFTYNRISRRTKMYTPFKSCFLGDQTIRREQFAVRLLHEQFIIRQFVRSALFSILQ